MAVLLLVLTFFLPPLLQAADKDTEQAVPASATEDLRKQAQNPVANLISVPFQDNTDYNAGPFARDKNTLNIQPVIPHLLGDSVMLISRVITRLIFQPDFSQPHFGRFGLGDIQPTFFLSPATPGKLIWAAGPALLLPTATDNNLGYGRWCLGPSVIALVQPGRWTFGGLVSNLWSFAGSSSRTDHPALS